jgi:hypothetical protein
MIEARVGIPIKLGMRDKRVTTHEGRLEDRKELIALTYG